MDDFLKSVERRAYRMAHMACSHREEALDMVQDAMMRFATRYGDKPREKWKPLFYAILNNRIADHHRRRYLRRKWEGWFGGGEDGEDPLAMVPDAAAVLPEHAAQVSDSFKALESALVALPFRQRQAFLLRVWEEMSVAETAKAMGCSQGSVKTHLSRALAALKLDLGEHWP